MAKLLILIVMSGLWITLIALQTDEEQALQLLNQSKSAVNRATHAGAQQIDLEALGDGYARIDPEAAYAYAKAYLQSNLMLDETGEPLPGSPFKEAVQVLLFDVINEDNAFPYFYTNETYHYETVLKHPGVVMIAKVTYPRAFHVLDPISWEIKGVAELVLAI
ncbi:hypothetical protein [Paenibacillus protaetiae]|uniref:Uncharacterized protein n=1 Tax=Paenibacillus protaetiae TaxID=2509456 RepID=A0A4P6EYG4_9BACL|nr:hypothetical protein [Paenibacillus protaetiae]QAY66829.1 hypothetical protein ET464_10925 [Paenibacillus protaetiae]